MINVDSGTPNNTMRLRKWNAYVFNILLSVGAKFIFIIPFAAILLFKSKDTKVNLSKTLARALIVSLPMLIILTMLSLYSIASGNSLDFVFFEARDVFIAIFLLSIMIAATRNEFDTHRMVASVEKVVAFIGLIKVGMILYCALTGMSLYLMVKGLSEFMGWTLQSYTTSVNFIARVQFPYDCIIPLVLFFSFSKLLQGDGNRKERLLVISLILISVFFTMSRAFWALSLVMIFTAVLLNSSMKKIFTFFAMAFVSLLIVYFSASRYIDEAVSSRINAETNYSSDSYRIMQNNKLINKFDSAPMLGKGIGYFIPDFTRAVGDARYTYESQLLSMFMKIGLLGVIALFGSFIYTCFAYDDSYKNKPIKKIMIKCIMILSWLGMGAVNPLLFVTNGAMMLYLASRTNYFIK
ncbi:O-antigen ligase family protein [Serratia silvae]|uniref:O-antigen ligase family protein n=1 Tax=Serratia silvae TaxID=2824122 RepID=A0ABT0K728_9GAMM|nr:O-antigen ligase family protein [Serratia silvae]MCL1027836.1 O-antigen ligase family protein [Serratia silvae]